MAAINESMGRGTRASLTSGARIVRALATILQIPIAVTLFEAGNIVSSLKQAEYEARLAAPIPNLVAIRSRGIKLLMSTFWIKKAICG
jgi:hypothetical protein